MNCLNKKIGIIGGGQLGKMMILEAKRLGFYVITLDPTLNCPSHSISDEHIVADFHDEKALRQLAEKSDVITYEFEHIDATTLLKLEKEGHTIYPSCASLTVIQNKYTQKQALKTKQIPVPEFIQVSSIEDIFSYGENFGYPIMLKACLDGYDGKGNFLIKAKEEVETAFSSFPQTTPLMIEEFIPFIKEVSVIATRAINGTKVVYPVAHNIHKNSILDTTFVPAEITDNIENRAKELAEKVMDVFDGVGTFCIEMFILENGSIYINEVAPRPHNSGHYTIEACRTNQFENHIRAIVDLPLGDTSLLMPAVMINLLGTESNGIPEVLGLEKAYNYSGINLHIYGKETSKIGRKMGHFTVTDKTLNDAMQKANEVRKILKIIGKEK